PAGAAREGGGGLCGARPCPPGAPSRGSATPTRFPLLPPVSPPLPPVPIRLYELTGSTVPLMSLAAVRLMLSSLRIVAVLRATIVLNSSTLFAAVAPSPAARPPPVARPAAPKEPSVPGSGKELGHP